MFELRKVNLNQDLEKVLQIRKKVFVEEQGVPIALENDQKKATYFLLETNQIPVATGRYRKTEKGFKIERMAVLPEFRNKGFGSKILHAILNDLENTKEKIYLNAQIKAVDFYLQHDFKISGEKFIEAEIVHFPMEYYPKK